MNAFKKPCGSIEEVKNLTLLEIPLRSKYRVLMFYGDADGSSLSKSFDLDLIKKRIIIIKSFKIVPYTSAAGVDFFITDGTTVNKETVPTLSRINRLFDYYDAADSAGQQLTFYINDNPLGFFPSRKVVGGYPLDMFLDNIFYLYPEKVETIDIKINAKIYDDIQAVTTAIPKVKVLVECYLI